MTKKPQSGIGSQTQMYKATTLPSEPPPLYMLLCIIHIILLIISTPMN